MGIRKELLQDQLEGDVRRVLGSRLCFGLDVVRKWANSINGDLMIVIEKERR